MLNIFKPEDIAQCKELFLLEVLAERRLMEMHHCANCRKLYGRKNRHDWGTWLSFAAPWREMPFGGELMKNEKRYINKSKCTRCGEIQTVTLAGQYIELWKKFFGEDLLTPISWSEQ